MTPAQREARLRAARRLVDDYRTQFGQERQYGHGGEDGVAPPDGDGDESPRARARADARGLVEGGASGLRTGAAMTGANASRRAAADSLGMTDEAMSKGKRKKRMEY